MSTIPTEVAGLSDNPANTSISTSMSTELPTKIISIDLPMAMQYVNPNSGFNDTTFEHITRTCTASSIQTRELFLRDDKFHGRECKLSISNLNGTTVINSINSLAAGAPSELTHLIQLEQLPDIIQILQTQGLRDISTIGFSISLSVIGRITGRFPSLSHTIGIGSKRRSHYIHLLFTKDLNNKLNIIFIDSTQNPIAIANPLAPAGEAITTSLISGEELLQAQMARLLCNLEFRTNLQLLFSLTGNNLEQHIELLPALFIGEQAILGDKYCGVYVINAKAAYTDFILRGKPGLTAETDTSIDYRQVISTVITRAHQELNQPGLKARIESLPRLVAPDPFATAATQDSHCAQDAQGASIFSCDDFDDILNRSSPSAPPAEIGCKFDLGLMSTFQSLFGSPTDLARKKRHQSDQSVQRSEPATL